jgi:hypothetical protein
MRKLALVLLLFIVPTTVLAQEIDRDRDRWRERRSFFPRENRIELTAFGGYRYGGTIYADRTDLFGIDLDVASRANWGAELGVPIGDTPMKLELMANRQNTHLTAGSGLFEPDERVADFDITYYHAGIQFPFTHSEHATPFVVLSAGIANLDPRISGVSAENRFSASAGLGVKVPFGRNIGLRVEARGYFTSLGSSNDDDCFRCDYENDKNLYQGETNVGLVFSF